MYHGAEWPKSLLTPACAQTCAAPLDMSGQTQEHLANGLRRGGEGYAGRLLCAPPPHSHVVGIGTPDGQSGAGR